MLLLVTALCLLLLPSCIPVYMAGARLAVSTVAVAASGVTAGAAPEGEVPQERGALYEGYVRCLRQRELNPGVDCGPYRRAMEATAP
jgi:hypothetical protein